MKEGASHEKQNEPNLLRFQPKIKDYQKNEPNSNPFIFRVFRVFRG